MDEKVTKWILEFLLRKRSIDDKIINAILQSFPLFDNDNRLKKTLLLRKIESEISSGSFSEKLLEFLEIIEELDNGEGKIASELIKEAYCSVAVDCTVRFLEDNVKENEKYFEAVERVWRNRVCTMEALGSDESSRWWGDIEAAVWDSSVCEKILLRNTRNEALRAVRRYLKEGWMSLGPTFLEFVADKLGDRVEELRIEHSGCVSSGDQRHEVVLSQGTQKSQSISRRKHVAVKTKRPRGAKISDTDEDPEGSKNMANNVTTHEKDEVHETNNITSSSLPNASHSARDIPLPTGRDHNDVITHNTEKVQEACKSRNNSKIVTVFENQTKHVLLHSSPEVTKVREALKNSAEDLRAVVKDPLPEALQTADALCSTGVENPTRAPQVGPVQQNLEPNSREVDTNVRDPSLDAFRAVENEPSKIATNSMRNNDQLTNRTQEDIQAPRDPADENNNGRILKEKDKLVENNPENVRKKVESNRKRSLMEPNGTGHTMEWDDSIDESSGRERITLPSSSKRSRVAPLQPYVDKRLSRRERRKWTPHEEETLRDAVKKFGRRWKFILEHYSDVFSDRTDGDLKDKWRNMLKYIS